MSHKCNIYATGGSLRDTEVSFGNCKRLPLVIVDNQKTTAMTKVGTSAVLGDPLISYWPHQVTSSKLLNAEQGK